MTSPAYPVLIVDDDRKIRKLISYHLKKNGFSLVEVDTGEEALAVLAGQRISIAVCDLSLPGIDGIELVRRIRAEQQWHLMPVLVITGTDEMQTKITAMDSGADDVLLKPFTMDDLLLKINALLNSVRKFANALGAAEQPPWSAPAAQPRILLVDDDEHLVTLFSYNLKQKQFTVDTANDAKTALQLAREHTPDIIVSDIMMPETDGIEFRRMILREPELQQIPFIFLTANASEELMYEGFDLGITDYVLKTAGPKLVVAKVTALINSLQGQTNKVINELNKAVSSMNLNLIPEQKPLFEGFCLEHWHQPFKNIPGGDFLDYFQLDEHRLAVIMGDVMGKKWSAWHFAVAYAGYIRSAVRSELEADESLTPASVLTKINQTVFKDNKLAETFTTLSVILIDNRTREISYAGAGDLPVFIAEASTRKIAALSAGGLLLGFQQDGGYKNITRTMQSGDRLFMLTDGVLEAVNTADEPFGKGRLQHHLNASKNSSDPLADLKKELHSYTGGKYDDDITVIMVEAE